MHTDVAEMISIDLSSLTGPQLIELADRLIGKVPREEVEKVIESAQEAFDVVYGHISSKFLS